jgi:hypothetical protein
VAISLLSGSLTSIMQPRAASKSPSPQLAPNKPHHHQPPVSAFHAVRRPRHKKLTSSPALIPQSRLSPSLVFRPVASSTRSIKRLSHRPGSHGKGIITNRYSGKRGRKEDSKQDVTTTSRIDTTLANTWERPSSPNCPSRRIRRSS